MDIRQLELFLAVLEADSVTGAARRANLSPGAVSLQMQSLATSLHTELFVRVGKHLKPTAAGLRLAELAREVVRRAQEIRNEFDSLSGDDTRPFHLATGATTLIHRLGQPLRQIRKRYPHAHLDVTVSATEEMIAGLIERRFDLAIVSLPIPVGTQDLIRTTPLYEEELLVLKPSAKNVPGWHLGSISPVELRNARFVLYPKRSNMRAKIDAFFRELDVSPAVVMEADDTEAIIGLVSAGFGYSILPESALHRKPRFFHVARVPGQRLTRQQALAIPRTSYPRPLTESIARLLREVLTAKSK